MFYKPFHQVFYQLKITGELYDIFSRVEVYNMMLGQHQTRLRVFIRSNNLIDKKDILHMEKLLAETLFPDGSVQVRLVEQYNLSAQYTPRKLLDVYRESILLDFKQESSLLYSLLHQADWNFTGEDHLVISLPESPILKQKADKIVGYICHIFQDRCGFSITASLDYISSDHSKREKVRKNQEVMEVRAVLRQNHQEGYLNAQEVPEETATGKVIAQPLEKSAKQTNAVSSAPEKREHDAVGNRKQIKAGKASRGDGDGNVRPYKRSDHPGALFGRDFEGSITPIEQLDEGSGEVVIRGQVYGLNYRELRDGKKAIVTFALTDFTDSIRCKLFLAAEHKDSFLADFKDNLFVEIKGVCLYDTYDKELGITSITGMRKGEDFRPKRRDLAVEKRVELHCHTKMSELDAVADVKQLLDTARSWGHPAIAITDHGCVQAFTEALHAREKNDPLKVIYGLEGYLVDDEKNTVTNSQGQSLHDTVFVVFDIETTGFSPVKNKIIEIGAVKVQNGQILDRFSELINPEVPIPLRIENLTGINDLMVLDKGTIEAIFPKFMAFCEGTVLVAHNADFDVSFIRHNAKIMGFPFPFTYVDTLGMARSMLPHLHRYKLDTVAKDLGIRLDNHHRAVDDAECTAQIFLRLLEKYEDQGVGDLTALQAFSKIDGEGVKKLPTYHIIILAANETGRINLYRLVSMSHLQYFARRPRIPKSVLRKYREGLILGSACEAGELMQAIIREEPEEDVLRIAGFYDYLEIQPLANNRFLLDKEDSAFRSEEDLRNLNRKVVQLGETLDKPVVATCDAHFIQPEDEIYRRMILAGKGYGDADVSMPLYLRTTDEMLQEFSYLGSDKAYEVVITNPNKINDRIEEISPVRPDKCPPVIENSDRDLRNMCYAKAKAWYGEPLPEIVQERLERELNSIISNGFAVMYIIAQKLVTKSNADGYLVGSRGSVGSSFVATMADITEVNPLSPHYRCPKCHYSDFDSPEVKAFAGSAGCDMPDRDCPVCGTKLIKDGFDIPFETFLGFKGNKEPDIDLNFSGEYQSKAHAYTEVIFGAGQTFRAGTVGTLADKTAYGYVYNYYKERNIVKRNCEMERLAQGCTGVRRSTGQHPGGIIVLPHGEEIYSFTPVQHPANDTTTNIVTTHFDYHSIDHNLLKLDILGHDDPTMIRMLQDLTGEDPVKFPLDDSKVMSLFKSTEALGIRPEDIGGTQLGALGIPEFGTDFAMQMLIDTQPRYFSDLVRISGLSHGTDVWLGNAQTLLKEKKATIQTAICTRDDIMIYLIGKGLDSEESFTIMESVRKGKGLKPEWEAHMTECGVPDWYIWSCKKIKYMFPKAHAAAYVMMAWRIAYCKVYYPLAFYAAYFSIRATGFSYELMCQGKEKLQYYLDLYKKRADSKTDPLSNKEQDTLKDMRLVQEMYARGFSFWPLDFYKAKATRFQIIDGKIMPSFSSVDGMGEKAALSLEEAAKQGPFLSKEDLRNRAKLSKTLIETLDQLGLLKGMSESNQLSLFDQFDMS